MDNLAAWFLITVLNSGQVGDAKGFPTKALCEDAKSIAMYGMTVKEKERHDREVREYERVQDSIFRAKHPCRPMTDGERKKYGGSGPFGVSMSWTCSGEIGGLYTEGDSICDLSCKTHGMRLYNVDPNGIKHAECVRK